jgi:protein-L-isoaspartate(D-aspartate) O-methyltransferase
LITTSELRHQLREELEVRGISDARVLDAIESIERDRFVPEALQAAAYEDSALPIENGQTISQPYIVALMTQELELTGSEKVLEVGTGSGYQAAILARLCQSVVTIERIESLSLAARKVLGEMGFENITFLVGDGTLGNQEHAPYDRIIVTASAPSVPEPLYQQLILDGRLVAPIGDDDTQELVLVEKTDSRPTQTPLCGCRFVKLIGQAGWRLEE